jgi:2-phosphoglycolate phosphatase
MNVDAVLFDLDGTLIDSIGIYYKIVDIVFDRLSLPPVPREAFVEAAKDGDFDWNCVLPEDLQDRKDEIIQQATGIIYEIYQEMFGRDLKLISGADTILREVFDDGMKIGIVTSTPEEGMSYKRQLLEASGIDKWIDVIITADDVEKKKPAAEPLIECLNRLNVAPPKSVYVGDARIDIKAGKAAGMKTIGVLTGFDNSSALQAENPDAILRSVRHLPEAIAMNSR